MRRVQNGKQKQYFQTIWRWKKATTANMTSTNDLEMCWLIIPSVVAILRIKWAILIHILHASCRCFLSCSSVVFSSFFCHIEKWKDIVVKNKINIWYFVVFFMQFILYASSQSNMLFSLCRLLCSFFSPYSSIKRIVDSQFLVHTQWKKRLQNQKSTYKSNARWKIRKECAYTYQS